MLARTCIFLTWGVYTPYSPIRHWNGGWHRGVTFVQQMGVQIFVLRARFVGNVYRPFPHEMADAVMELTANPQRRTLVFSCDGLRWVLRRRDENTAQTWREDVVFPPSRLEVTLKPR